MGAAAVTAPPLRHRHPPLRCHSLPQPQKEQQKGKGAAEARREKDEKLNKMVKVRAAACMRLHPAVHLFLDSLCSCTAACGGLRI